VRRKVPHLRGFNTLSDAQESCAKPMQKLPKTSSVEYSKIAWQRVGKNED